MTLAGAKVLLVGAGGQLARELVETAPEGVALDARDIAALDITDASAVARAVDEARPAVILNAAAYTAVDQAEREPELADLVNHRAVANLARAASACGARLVQVSTDYVFDGRSAEPYEIDAPTNPVSVYGRTKRDGELAALSAPDALVVRTAWVYAAHSRNFVATMLRLMHERDEVRVVSDQFGTPTSARGLAAAIWALVACDARGILHWTDAGSASWYDFAVAIRDEAVALGSERLRATRVTPIRTVDFPTPARRPAMSVLAKDATWRLVGPGRHWREALRDELAQMDFPRDSGR
jgi:dTDP-4-dehydrorhamnose reductase